MENKRINKEDIIAYIKKRYSEDEIQGIGNRCDIDSAEYYSAGMPKGKVARNFVDTVFEQDKTEEMFEVLKKYYFRKDLEEILPEEEKEVVAPDVKDAEEEMVPIGKSTEGSRTGNEPQPVLEADPDAVRLKKGLKAIIIGVEKYLLGKGKNDLPGAAGDAEALAEFLEKDWGLPQENIYKFIGTVNYKDVVDEIRKICESLTDRNNLLFYFAGHGEEIGGHSSLLMTDTSVVVENSTPVFLNGIPLDDLNAILRKCRAKTKVRIFDACHCGQRFSRELEELAKQEGMTEEKMKAFLEDESSWIERPTERSLENESEDFKPATRDMMEEFLVRETDWITFCACNVNECSYDLPWLGHGVFTYYLIKGLKGTARRGNGPMHIEDLKIYVCNLVPKMMAHFGRAQHPQYQCEIQKNVIVE